MQTPFDPPMLTPAERLVLAALLHEPGASVDRIALITGMEPAVVKRALVVVREVTQKDDS